MSTPRALGAGVAAASGGAPNLLRKSFAKFVAESYPAFWLASGTETPLRNPA